MLPITLTIAGAVALLNLWLVIRVGQVRRAAKVSVGDGGDARLIARMRAQANFIEHAPIVLILMALIELAKGERIWLWLTGIAFVLARIAHALGMDRAGGYNPLRTGGFTATALIVLGLAIVALTIPYTAMHAAS